MQLPRDIAEPAVDSTGKACACGAWCKLAACCCAIGVTWLLVLPWLAERPTVHERLEWLNDRQIDPSAMYYTELEAMQPILRRLEGRPHRDELR